MLTIPHAIKKCSGSWIFSFITMVIYIVLFLIIYFTFDNYHDPNNTKIYSSLAVITAILAAFASLIASELVALVKCSVSWFDNYKPPVECISPPTSAAAPPTPPVSTPAKTKSAAA